MTPILVAPDVSTPIGELKVGDAVWTRHENGGDMGYHQIARAGIYKNIRCELRLMDGRSVITAVNHRVCVSGVWTRVDSLEPGTRIDGEPGGVVAAVEYLGEGDVCQLIIPSALTYYGADGIWHHNIKP